MPRLERRRRTAKARLATAEALLTLGFAVGCGSSTDAEGINSSASRAIPVERVTESREVRTGAGVIPGSEILEPLPPTMSPGLSANDAIALLSRADLMSIADGAKTMSIALGLYTDNLLTSKESGELVYVQRPVYVFHFEGVPCPPIGRTPFATTDAADASPYSCYSEAFVDANTGVILFESGTF